MRAAVDVPVLASLNGTTPGGWTDIARQMTDAGADAIELDLYDNKAGIVGTQKENFGMIIESADLHRTMTNLFEVMWQITRVGKRVD